MNHRNLLIMCLSCLALALTGCGDGETSGDGPERPGLIDGDDDGRRPGANGRPPRDGSVPDASATPDAGTDASGGSDGGDDPSPDVDAGGPNRDNDASNGGDDLPDTTPVDPAPDTPPEPDPCDMDGDGYLSIACGGDDCDDNNRLVNPGAREVCSFDDNNCSGVINDGLDCRVYAHSSQRLYLVDPFTGHVEEIGSVPNLFDFDIANDGTLYGLSSSQLFRYDDGSETWQTVGSLGAGIGVTFNGLAIDSRNRAFATGGNSVYTVDLATGRATLLGAMGGGFNSSGDCVVNKDDSLYMTSSGSGTDDFVFIDGTTARAELVGNTGFRSIYGLTAAWGYMFGFTAGGEIIEIDISDGRGRLLHRTPGIIWYGAASGSTR